MMSVVEGGGGPLYSHLDITELTVIASHCHPHLGETEYLFATGEPYSFQGPSPVCMQDELKRMRRRSENRQQEMNAESRSQPMHSFHVCVRSKDQFIMMQPRPAMRHS